jgi:hypothetical protein
VTTSTPTLTADVFAPETGESVHAELSVDGEPFLPGSSVSGSGTSALALPAVGEGIHTWTVRARDSQGGVSATFGPLAIQVDTVVPTVPSTVTYSPNPNSTGSHEITWSPSLDAISSLASYEIRRSQDGGTTWTAVATLPVTSTNTAWKQDPPLTDGTYIYQVRARDNAGNVSSWSSNTNAVQVQGAGPTGPMQQVSASGGELRPTGVVNSPKRKKRKECLLALGSSSTGSTNTPFLAMLGLVLVMSRPRVGRRRIKGA